jgi:hypothetical protein
VETLRKFITAKLSIRKLGSSSVLIICDLFNSHNISTYTGWRKKKLTCLIYFNLKTKRAIRPKLRALHSVLFNLNFDIRPVQLCAILTERAAFKLE